MHRLYEYFQIPPNDLIINMQNNVPKTFRAQGVMANIALKLKFYFRIPPYLHNKFSILGCWGRRKDLFCTSATKETWPLSGLNALKLKFYYQIHPYLHNKIFILGCWGCRKDQFCTSAAKQTWPPSGLKALKLKFYYKIPPYLHNKILMFGKLVGGKAHFCISVT